MPFRNSRWLLLLGVLAVGAVVVAVGRSEPGLLASQVDQTVSRRPTPFTELYFTSASSLPKVLVPGVPSGFEFTIANHELDATTYHYVVSGVASDTSQAIASGDVTLASGTGKSVPVSFVPAVLGADYVVTVRLANRVETVHFATRS